MEKKYIALAAGLVAGTLMYNNGPVEKECFTYQGHRTVDNTNTAVFDDKPLAERVDAPDLIATYVFSEDVENLEIGKEYSVEFRESRIAGLPKLLSASVCN